MADLPLGLTRIREGVDGTDIVFEKRNGNTVAKINTTNDNEETGKESNYLALYPATTQTATVKIKAEGSSPNISIDLVPKGTGTVNHGGASASGDVSGPASSTDNAIVRYDGTTGKLVQNSGVTIDDSGNVNLPNLAAVNATIVTGVGTGLHLRGPATGNVLVINNSDVAIASPLYVTNTTASISTTTGALTVAGGAGIAGALNVGGDTTLAGYTIEGTNASGMEIKAPAYMEIKPTTANTGSTPGGSLSLEGGYAGSGTTGSGGAVLVAGGTSVNADGGHVYVYGGEGQAGNDGNVYLGHASYSGNVQVRTTTASSSTTTGALTVAGGAGIAGALNVGGATATTGISFDSGTNTLSNYAENTSWTPTFSSLTNISSATISGTGQWNRIGNRVWFEFNVTVVPSATGNASFVFTLPVNKTTTTTSYAVGTAWDIESPGWVNTGSTTNASVSMYPTTTGSRIVAVQGSYIVR